MCFNVQISQLYRDKSYGIAKILYTFSRNCPWTKFCFRTFFRRTSLFLRPFHLRTTFTTLQVCEHIYLFQYSIICLESVFKCHYLRYWWRYFHSKLFCSIAQSMYS